MPSLEQTCALSLCYQMFAEVAQVFETITAARAELRQAAHDTRDFYVQYLSSRAVLDRQYLCHSLFAGRAPHAMHRTQFAVADLGVYHSSNRTLIVVGALQSGLRYLVSVRICRPVCHSRVSATSRVSTRRVRVR